MKVKLMDTGHDIFRMNDHFRYIFRTNVPIIFTCIFSSEKRACHVQVYDKPKLLWKTIFICWWYHPHVHAWQKDKKKNFPCSFLKTLITKSLTTYGIFKLRSTITVFENHPKCLIWYFHFDIFLQFLSY